VYSLIAVCNSQEERADGRSSSSYNPPPPFPALSRCPQPNWRYWWCIYRVSNYRKRWKRKNANHRDLYHPTQEYWSTFEYISSRAMTGENNHDFLPLINVHTHTIHSLRWIV
jgi:hypothetical protein